jgi:hypothetical protein
MAAQPVKKGIPTEFLPQPSSKVAAVYTTRRSSHNGNLVLITADRARN